MKKLLFTAILIGTCSIASAQYGYRDSNRIGISGGINQFGVISGDLDTKPGIGWQAGLSVRGNFYNDFDMVYDIRFAENKFSIGATLPADREVECKIQSAQISLLLSYKFIENHLSVEFGPMFQFNGKLDVKDQDKLVPIADGVVVEDIQDIPFFNFYPTLGITGGAKHVRAHIYLQYGITNLFRGLEEPANDIKGNGMILGGNICFYL